jgi:hypothetical protein
MITQKPLLSGAMSEETPKVMWSPMTTTLVVGFTRSVKRHHQKRHAEDLCTPPDENIALLSWEVAMSPNVG